MANVYTVSFGKTAVTAIVDLFELIPADDKPLEVIGLVLGQSSDVGDAAAEILPYKVGRGWTTTGSGGASPTPTAIEAGDTAGFSAKTCNSTVAKEGTETIIHQDCFNIAVGEKLWLPEGCGWKCSQSQTRLTVRLLTAPADELTMTGTIYVRETI